ncbi:hypothetical protein [Sporosarcina sp. A2]|uniref:hypothetical protein n=1 Tax=Sporosarcina sp. A2 TaxID=3393449 RepID=UPI003D7AFB48
MNDTRWLLIGADRRLQECARIFKEKNLDVAVFPHDDVTDYLQEKIEKFRPTHIVLPIQGLKNELPVQLFKPNTVFCGGIISDDQKAKLLEAGHSIFIYLTDERFVWNNAHLTAEGFLKEFYNETEDPIKGTSFQLAGFGRVGRMVAHTLGAAGAKLTVFARSETQLGEAEALGFEVKKLEPNIEFQSGYMINTIPAQWLSIPKEGTLRVFDLASKPGCLKPGMSSAYYTLHLGLPGKHFPQQAASYLAESILRMCRGKE